MAELQRWDPFAGLTTMHSQIDDMFNNFFGGNFSPSPHGLPAIDVYTEADKQLVAEVHAPGFDKGDLDIKVRDNVLEIKGEKHDKQEDKDKKDRNYMVRESHASFYRSIMLPKVADEDNVQAHFDNGVLKVTVPFKELPQPKKIAIGGGKDKK